MEAQLKQKVWISAKEAADHVGIAYARFTALASAGEIPRTLVPGTKRKYRYNVGQLDAWMMRNQEGRSL